MVNGNSPLRVKPLMPPLSSVSLPHAQGRMRLRNSGKKSAMVALRCAAPAEQCPVRTKPSDTQTLQKGPDACLCGTNVCQLVQAVSALGSSPV